MPNSKYYNNHKSEILEKQRVYYLKNKERIKRRMQHYRKINPHKIKQQSKDYRERYSKKIKDKSKTLYFKNRELIYERVKRWRKENPEKYREQWRSNIPKTKERRKQRYLKNKDVILARQKAYSSRPENKIKKRLMDKEYVKKNKDKIWKQIRDRKKSDPEFRIKCNLRNRLFEAMKRYTKTGKIMSSKKYGIDYKAIIEHLKPFPKDISKYHIDHIKPLCSFEFVNEDGLTNLEEVRKAFAPTNHQWLLAEENQKKRMVDGSMQIAVRNRWSYPIK